MGDKSRIEWTDATWNPVTGCTKVSEGCRYCYAEALTKRYADKWGDFATVRLKPERLEMPLRWTRPRMVFVNSMSDLFQKDVPDEYIVRVFDVMARARQHTFQVLTKRPERMMDFTRDLAPTANVWLGTSVEDGTVMRRVADLGYARAAVRFLSCEPLIGRLDYLMPSLLKAHRIGWVIVGGESGPHHRPMKLDWAREIRDACVAARVPFFFKQVGGITGKANGRTLDGRTWEEMPATMAEQGA